MYGLLLLSASTLPFAVLSRPAIEKRGLPALTSTPNQVTILNSCDYTVHLTTVPGGTEEYTAPPPSSYTITPGETHYEPFRILFGGHAGISFKITREQSDTKPLQFEYTATTDGKVFYNLSFVDCVQGKDKTDASSCTGHDKGLQVVAKEGDAAFVCNAGEYCANRAYYIEEFGYQAGAPVGSSDQAAGLAFELCAGNRAS